MSALRFFAACSLGLEPALEEELRELGADGIEERRGGIAFRGDHRLGYAANLWLRSAIRVQEQLQNAWVADGDELYDAAAQVDWASIMTPKQTLAVYASVRDTPGLTHSGYVALRVKDAIVDRLRDRYGSRPDVDPKQPDVAIRLQIQRGRMRLYRDWSGTSLHKRGWRRIQVKSPLNEAVAAGLLRLTGWDRQSPLVDPMCGSGTFPIEAAWWALDRAPGLERPFAFERFIDHDKKAWFELLEEASSRVKPRLDFPIEGADHHPGAISLARKGARGAGVDRVVRFTESDARDFVPREKPALAVVNPPYGERMGRDEGLLDSWDSLGNFLHRQCGGATAWVLSGNKEVTRRLGLRTSLRVPVMNGKIECRWLKYEIRERKPRDPASEDGAPSA